MSAEAAVALGFALTGVALPVVTGLVALSAIQDELPEHIPWRKTRLLNLPGWSSMGGRHEHVRAEIGRYRSDLDLALATPKLLDVRLASGATLADSLARADAAADGDSFAAYSSAVFALEADFDEAVQRALRVGDGSLRHRMRGLVRAALGPR